MSIGGARFNHRYDIVNFTRVITVNRLINKYLLYCLINNVHSQLSDLQRQGVLYFNIFPYVVILPTRANLRSRILLCMWLGRTCTWKYYSYKYWQTFCLFRKVFPSRNLCNLSWIKLSIQFLMVLPRQWNLILRWRHMLGLAYKQTRGFPDNQH